MTARGLHKRLNPIDELKRSWTLDMIVPLDFEAEVTGSLLLDRWSDIAVMDLPPQVQEVVLGDPESWRAICQALVEPAVVNDACDAFVNGIRRRLVDKYRSSRIAEIALARAGLLSDDVPTLESLAHEWHVTRERVRQLVRDIQDEAKAEIAWHAPMRLVIGAQLALSPGAPFIIDSLARPETARGRVVKAVHAIGLLEPSVPFAVWTSTHAQRRGIEALVKDLPRLLSRANSFTSLEALAAGALPHINETLDLHATLQLAADRLDFGPGLDGRFGFGYAGNHERVAEKIVTYLQRRAVPIEPMELAHVVRKGGPPFEVFHRPLVEPDWLTECTRRNPSLLQLHPDGRIALARRLAHLRPTGNVGILHSIVVDQGEPMRMIDLCDRASQFGISRNEVGVFIHSGRAACLFMLNRGIVGLVGRDEGADPSQYEAARPVATTRVRVGEEIGFDSEGRIAVDIDVRRSIREQGFGLPWPFSILTFTDRPELRVDGQQRPMIVRSNGALDLLELEPGSRVRLRLAITARGHGLSVETTATDAVTPVRDRWNGSLVPIGLPPAVDRPGWIDFVIGNVEPNVKAPEEVIRAMPRIMVAKRRVRAFYALAALGFLERRKAGWISRNDRGLPAELADAFAAVNHDSSCYPVLPRRVQAAISWLVWATWLVPSVGWSRVRPNDLADAGGEDEGPVDVILAATSPRETTLMRIVEAAHHADDLRRHPGADVGVDATRAVVRRYLAALGYTAFNALRELDGTTGNCALSVHRASEAPVAIWMLLPLGAGISKEDVGRAERIARAESVTTAVATDGLQLVAIENGGVPSVDLREIGRHQSQFDRIMSLAADSPPIQARQSHFL